MKIPLSIVACLFSSLIYAQQCPNIIFVLSDDHACQVISSYGFGLNHTPNIDKLAHEGMLFTNAFVNNSLCLISELRFY